MNTKDTDLDALITLRIPVSVGATIALLAKREGAAASAIGRRALIRGLGVLKDREHVEDETAVA
jgi:hypothetical protein